MCSTNLIAGTMLGSLDLQCIALATFCTSGLSGLTWLYLAVCRLCCQNVVKPVCELLQREFLYVSMLQHYRELATLSKLHLPTFYQCLSHISSLILAQSLPEPRHTKSQANTRLISRFSGLQRKKKITWTEVCKVIELGKTRQNTTH